MKSHPNLYTPPVSTRARLVPHLGRPVADHVPVAVSEREGADSLRGAGGRARELAKAAREGVHHHVAERRVGGAGGREAQRVRASRRELERRRQPVLVELPVGVPLGYPLYLSDRRPDIRRS